MRKLGVATLAAVLLAGSARADFTEGFEQADYFNGAGNLRDAGWVFFNTAEFPTSTTLQYGWDKPNTSLITSTGRFPAQAGTNTSYLYSNFNALTGSGTISTWAILPTQTFAVGDTFSFWTRQASSDLSGGTPLADRLQVRLSLAGSALGFSVEPNPDTPSDPRPGPTEVGNFTTLLLDINPTETVTPNVGSYPTTWTQFTVTMTTAGTGRLAFRYFLSSDAGSLGDKSEYFGIDSLAYTTTPIPEPSTYALIVLGGGLLLGARRKLRNKARANVG